MPTAPDRSCPPRTYIADSPETSPFRWMEGRNTAKCPSMKVFQHETKLRTAGGLTVTDITEEVCEAVRESGIEQGIACIYSPHTTCCVRVNEFESGFLEDF